jgi:phenylacetate-CoA ligase
VIELYGSTETMLLGTSCRAGTLHLETALAHCEVLDPADDAPTPPGVDGRLVVTTLAVEGSPLVRFDTGDLVRPTPPCACGDPRPGIVVLGRAADAVELAGRRLHSYELVDAGAAAADALDSAVFFLVLLPDRVLVRIETRGGTGDPQAAFAARLPGVPVEVEAVAPEMLLDVELMARSPHVYKPVVVADWRRPGRRILTVGEGMIEWPRPTWAEGRRWLARTLRTVARRRRLTRQIRVARPSGH